MNKNIVLCADGTGNTANKARGTNVFKLYEAVDIQGHKYAPEHPPQVAFYDDGVGTSSFLPLKLLGGAVGFGFAKNVRDLYIELAHVYEPGDRIYLFGFSRGAYTVRALSGLIEYCGVPDVKKIEHEELREHVRHCWRGFREAAFKGVSDEQRRSNTPEDIQRADGERRNSFRAVMHDEHAPQGAVPIEFVGVWDTVGAVGAPFEGMRTLINWIWPMRFAELTPSKAIKRACHALSIDDDRRTFSPELWNEQGGTDPRVSQVWFAGAHSNVGGGYVKQGMSLVALDWMMAEAEQCGLRFIPSDRDFARAHQDVHGHMYDPRSGLGLYYRWQPRDIAQLCQAHQMPTPKIHVSVLERIANGTDSYTPANLPYHFEAVTTNDRQRPQWPTSAELNAVRVQMVAWQSTWQQAHADESMLDSLRGALRSGKLSYYLFLIASAPFAAVLALWKLHAWIPESLQERLWAAPSFTMWIGTASLLVLGGGLAWRWSKQVDARIESMAHKYWHPCRAALRSRLGTRVAGTAGATQSEVDQPVTAGRG